MTFEERKIKEFDKLFLARENKKRVIKTGLSPMWANFIKQFLSTALSEYKEELLSKMLIEDGKYCLGCGFKIIKES